MVVGHIAEYMGVIMAVDVNALIEHDAAVFHGIQRIGDSRQKIDVMGNDHIRQVDAGQYVDEFYPRILIQPR